MSTATTDRPSPAPAPTPGERRENLAYRALRLVLVERPVLLLVALVVVLAYFGQYQGYLTLSFLGEQTAISLEVGLLALGQLVVILTGRGAIDLSAGAMVSMASMVFGFTAGLWGWPLPLAVAATLAAGWLMGALNGYLAAYVGYPAIIVTLATWYVWRSVALVVNDTKPISAELPGGIDDLIGTVAGLRLHILVVFVPVVVVIWVMLNRTTFGRRIYGVGTNETAAHFAGLQVARTRFHAFAISGLLAGIAAITVTAFYHSARPDAGDPMVLRAITVAVLGGVAISGGAGKVSGVVLATLLVAFLNGGLTLLEVGSRYQLAALGALLLGSALLNVWSQRRFRVQ